MKKDSIDFIL